MDGGWRDVLIAFLVLVGAYLAVTLLRLAGLRRRRKPAGPPETRVPPSVPVEEFRTEAEMDSPAFGAALERAAAEKTELENLRAEVLALREEMAEIKAAQRVSPQYADAMALAQRGLGAQDIADRCEISLAEAELVLSLSRGQTGLEGKDDHGGDTGRSDV